MIFHILHSTMHTRLFYYSRSFYSNRDMASSLTYAVPALVCCISAQGDDPSTPSPLGAVRRPITWHLAMVLPYPTAGDLWVRSRRHSGVAEVQDDLWLTMRLSTHGWVSLWGRIPKRFIPCDLNSEGYIRNNDDAMLQLLIRLTCQNLVDAVIRKSGYWEFVYADYMLIWRIL